MSAEVTRIKESLDGLATLAGRVAAEQADAIAAIADRYEATLRGGGTLFFAGNGGSAADAQHVGAWASSRCWDGVAASSRTSRISSSSCPRPRRRAFRSCISRSST